MLLGMWRWRCRRRTREVGLSSARARNTHAGLVWFGSVATRSRAWRSHALLMAQPSQRRFMAWPPYGAFEIEIEIVSYRIEIHCNPIAIPLRHRNRSQCAIDIVSKSYRIEIPLHCIPLHGAVPHCNPIALHSIAMARCHGAKWLFVLHCMAQDGAMVFWPSVGAEEEWSPLTLEASASAIAYDAYRRVND